MSKEKREFDLEDRLIDFAVRIIRTAESLPKTKVGNHIAGQLIRSGTSPRSVYVCHFQGNYKENERVGQASQLRPQYYSGAQKAAPAEEYVRRQK